MFRQIAALGLTLGAIGLFAGASSCGTASDEQKNGASQVQMGDSQETVLNLAGKPDSKQTFRSTYNKPGDGMDDECWYYGIDVQVCFDGNSVTSVNNY